MGFKELERILPRFRVVCENVEEDEVVVNMLVLLPLKLLEQL
jgi:hypothetical protein